MDMMPTDISRTLDISMGKIIFAIDFRISNFVISVSIFALCQNYFGPLNSLAEKEKYARFGEKKTTKRWHV
jgi:hypothetical protein